MIAVQHPCTTLTTTSTSRAFAPAEGCPPKNLATSGPCCTHTRAHAHRDRDSQARTACRLQPHDAHAAQHHDAGHLHTHARRHTRTRRTRTRTLARAHTHGGQRAHRDTGTQWLAHFKLQPAGAGPGTATSGGVAWPVRVGDTADIEAFLKVPGGVARPPPTTPAHPPVAT